MSVGSNIGGIARRLLRDPSFRLALMLGVGLRASLSLWAWLVVSHNPGLLAAPPASLVAKLPPVPHWVSPLVTPWQRWDALEYQAIVAQGYHAGGREAVFFPLYPGLVKLATPLALGIPGLAAQMVSTIATVVALALLHRLAFSEWGRQVADRTVIYLALFPTAFFLFAGYTEAVFLCLSVGAFFAARRRHFLLAGGLAALATLCRFQGILLLVPLVIEGLADLRERLRAGWRWWNPAALALVLPLVAYAGWFLYVSRGLGIPNGPVGAEESMWGQRAVLPWQGVIDDLRLVFSDPRAWWLELVELGLLVAGIAGIVVMIVRRLPWSYVAYTAVSLLAMTSHEVGGFPAGISRYMLAVFPLFVVLALVVRRRVVHWGIVLGFTPLLALGLDHFTHYGAFG